MLYTKHFYYYILDDYSVRLSLKNFVCFVQAKYSFTLRLKRTCMESTSQVIMSHLLFTPSVMQADHANGTDEVHWMEPDADLLTGTFSYLTGFEIVLGSARNGTRRIVRPVTGESGLPMSSCRIYEFAVYTVLGGIVCLLGLLGTAADQLINLTFV